MCQPRQALSALDPCNIGSLGSQTIILEQSLILVLDGRAVHNLIRRWRLRIEHFDIWGMLKGLVRSQTGLVAMRLKVVCMAMSEQGSLLQEV